MIKLNTFGGYPDGPAYHSVPTFVLRESNPYLIEYREKSSSQIQESEYYTVSFKVSMTRRWKRLLLQTYLDSLLRREDFYITFADFLILEELYQSIYEEREEEGYEQKRLIYDIELCSITEKFLKFAPSKSHFFERPGLPDFREKVISFSAMLKTFKFSDERTYKSRVRTFQPSNFLEIAVVVPLPEFEERNSTRYSSYCKGHPTPGRKGEAPLPLELQPIDNRPPDEDPEILSQTIEFHWLVLTQSISD